MVELVFKELIVAPISDSENGAERWRVSDDEMLFHKIFMRLNGALRKLASAGTAGASATT